MYLLIFQRQGNTKDKTYLKENNVSVNTYESKIAFKEFKLNSEGLIPAVVQDYRTDSFNACLYERRSDTNYETGKMTITVEVEKAYGLKGETSDHYQYAKSMQVDCDKDTLAKVSQAGVAVTLVVHHVFTDLIQGTQKKIHKILSDVYEIVLDRKNTKEGSYTNYLFDMKLINTKNVEKKPQKL